VVAQLDKDYLLTRPGRAWSRLVSYALFEGRPLTTRGRWINPWLQQRFEHHARRSQTATIDRPLFILGTGRSGTTILGKILSLHPDVGWLNEPKLMWHVACPYEDLNGNYTDRTARYRLTEQDATQSASTAMRNLYASYLRSTSNSRVIDKYPELIFRLPFVKAIFPDARFIFLVRNGNDTCHSISNWSEDHGVQDTTNAADWWGSNRRKWDCLVNEVVAMDETWAPHTRTISALSKQSDMAAVEWVLSMQEGLAAMQAWATDIHMVRYEQLTQNPHEVLSDLLNFCELPLDTPVLRYAERHLRPPRPAPELPLPAFIEPYFATTMQQLGYA